jgi:hypothetical protein
VTEVVQVEAAVVSSLLRKGHEEANEEDDDDEEDKGNRVLEGAPEPLANGLLSGLGGILVVLLVIEVSEGYDEQTQHSIERVERVVDNLQRMEDAFHALRSCPILLDALAGERRRRHEGDIDGEQENRGEEGARGQGRDDSNGSCAVARGLVDEDEDGSHGQQQRDHGGVSNPDEARLYERHGGRCCLLLFSKSVRGEPESDEERRKRKLYKVHSPVRTRVKPGSKWSKQQHSQNDDRPLRIIAGGPKLLS